jgi:hypothetical protein
LTKEGAIPREHPGEFYDGPGDHDHHPAADSASAVADSATAESSEPTSNTSEMEVVSHENNGNGSEMNLETVE